MSESSNMPFLSALSRWDMVSMLPIKVHNGVFINGFPGAGNVVVQRLCKDILKTVKTNQERVTLGDSLIGNTYGDASQLLDCVGGRYNKFSEILNSSLPKKWATNSYFQNRGMGKMDFVAFNRPGFIIVTGIDLGTHLNTQIHSSHEVPIAENYSTYNALGYNIVPIIRHPLDTMVSYAAKGSSKAFFAFLDSLETKEQKNNAWKAHRFAVARQRMKDPCWLRVVASSLRSFYLPIIEMKEKYPPISYEDILNAPQEAVLKLASGMNIEMDKETAKEISSVIGNVELVPYHFNQPSNGKWRDFLSKENYDCIADTGILDIFEAFGYQIPIKEELTCIDYSATPEEYKILPTDVLESPELSRMESYFGLSNLFNPVELADKFEISNIHHIHHGSFMVVSNDIVLLERFSANLTNAVLHDLARQRADITDEMQNIQILLKHGATAVAERKFNEAEEIYREVLQIAPNYLPALEALANVLIESGKYQEALGLLNAAIVQAPDKPEIEAAIKLASEALSKLARQRADITDEMQNIQILLKHGAAAVADKKLNEAEEIYREVLQIAPNYLPALEALANVLIESGKYQEALGFLNAAIVQAPDKPEIEAAIKLASEAIHELARQRADITDEMQNIQILLKHGAAAVADKKLNEAEEIYREVLQIAPNYLPALEALANVLIESGKYQEALGFLNAAIVQAPDKPEIEAAIKLASEALHAASL